MCINNKAHGEQCCCGRAGHDALLCSRSLQRILSSMSPTATPLSVELIKKQMQEDGKLHPCAMAAQEAGYPDINIICEKVATEGETRFEDRYRLPIGISVNMTSFSAKCAPG